VTARILVAGIGNVFFGDDGFGPAVAQALAVRALPPGMVLRDTGIGGVHLAYELLEGFDLLVAIDAVPRGCSPGTLYVLEADLTELTPSSGDAHGVDLPAVFATTRALGGAVPRVLVVGCEPGELGEGLELSASVRQAVEPAAQLVIDIVNRELGAIERQEAR
jgi:hydrogenase maturation protease